MNLTCPARSVRPLENVPVPPYFALSAVLVYVGLVVDIFVGAYLTDHRFDPQFEVMAAVFQACAFLFTAMCLYNFLGETNLVKRSLFSKLLNEFAPVFCFGALYFLFIVITRIYRLVSVFAAVPRVEIWNRDGYAALYSGKCFGAFYTKRRVGDAKVFASPELVATRASYISEPRERRGTERGRTRAAASTGDATPARRNGRRKETETNGA